MNLDEEPVGQHKELDISEHPTSSFESDIHCKTEPLSECLLSKSPKTRLASLNELLELFSSCSPDIFLEYYPSFPRYLADTHPKARELAVQAFCRLVDRQLPAADKVLFEILTVILEKVLPGSRDQLKVKVMEGLVKLVEDEKIRLIVKEVIKENLNMKVNAKVAAAALYVLAGLLENFGVDCFAVSEFVESAVELAGSSNVNTRTQALNLLKEGYKWEKNTVIKAIEGLKPVQREELKKQFIENTDSIKPLQLLTIEESKRVKTEASTEVITPSKFNNCWCSTLIEKKKWNEKRDMLEELIQATLEKRIKSENLIELGKTLKLLLQDSNLVVSNLVLKALGELSKAYKNQFVVSAKYCFEAIVQKCKDKKSSTEVQKCLENLAYSLKLEEMLEPIKEALNNKSPLIKAKVCMWISSTVIPKVDGTLAKTMGLFFTPILTKLTDDASSEVRDAALSCLGTIKYYIQSDAKFDKLINVLTPQKQERLEKFVEQIPGPRNTNVKPGSRATSLILEEEIRNDKNSLSNLKSKSKPRRRQQQRMQSMTAPVKVFTKAANSKKRADYEVITEEDIGSVISAADATKQVFENVPTMILAQFDMTEWKEREKGLKELNDWIQNNPEKAQSMIESIIVWLERKFGSFKEVDIEITGELLSLFKTICTKCTINKRFAYEVVPVLVNNTENENMIDTCIEIALSIAKSANPSYVAALCIKSCYESQGNANIMNGGIQLLSKMLETYGAGLLPIKVTIDYAKDCLTNSLVSSSATQYIGAVHKIMGDSIKPWLADLNENNYEPLEPEPSKSYSPSPGSKQEHKTPTKPKKEATSKTNISGLLTTKLLSGLSAPLIKHRQEAKAELDKILQSASNGIAAIGLTPLISALKARMNDPCKSLLKGFIAFVGNLVVAVGQGFRQYSKAIVQPLMSNLGDKQADIRNETVATMDKIAVTSGSDIIFNSVNSVLEGNNTEGKNTMLRWILKHKSELNKCEVQCLMGALVGLIQEKSKETKELAEQVIGAVITQMGDTAFVTAMKDLRPMVKANLERIRNRFKFAERKSTELLEDESTEESKAKQKDIVRHKSSKAGSIVGKNKTRNAKATGEIRSEQDNFTIESSSFCLDSYFSNPSNKTGEIFKLGSKLERCKSPLEHSAISNSSMRQRARNQKTGSMIISRSTSDLSRQFKSMRKTRLREQKKPDRLNSEGTNISAFLVNVDDSIRINESKTDDKKTDTYEDEHKTENAIIAVLGNKEGRAELEKKFKWSVNNIKKENIERLKKNLRTCINPSLFEEMFSNQPKKIIAAANALTIAVADEFPSLLDLLDLLCKWTAVKMLEQVNPAVVKAMLEFLLSFFNKMEELHYKMLEFEAAFIIPMLCEKLDTSNTNFRQQFKELLKISAKLYNPTKITSYLMNTLETTKNKKVKLECLALIKEFMQLYDCHKIFIPKDIKGFVKLVNSSDNNLRTEGLDILGEVYNSRGDSIWTLTGKLTEKTVELLKKKFSVVDPTEMPKQKRSDNYFDGSCYNTEPKTKPSHRQSMSRFNETFCDDNLSITTLSNHKMRNSINKEHLTPSDSESLFNATGRLESDISPYIKHKGSKSISSKILMSSMDNSKFQEDDEIEITTLDEALEVLKSESISKRVNALMYLNEKTMSNLEEEKECLISHSNKLLLTFAEVLKELFDKPVKDIPIRFTKYFMTVVSKVCADKVIIQNVNEKAFSIFIEQIFMKLLYDGLEIMGDNNEGQYLIKALNLTVLRILEYYDPTKLFAILISLFMKYKDTSTGGTKLAKLPSLVAKCVLKLAKTVPNIIDNLNVSKVLLSLHEYLLMIPPSAIPKSANDDIGIRMAKTVIYELIKVRGETIWEDYKIIEFHQKADLHLQRWIHLILGTHYSGSTSLSKSIEEPTMDTSDELQEICQGLNSQLTFQDAIHKLSQYSHAHPDVDLVQYFSAYAKPLREFVLSSLERYNKQIKGNSISEPKNLLLGIGNSNEKKSSVSEYKSKLELLTQKYDIKNKEEEGNS